MSICMEKLLEPDGRRCRMAGQIPSADTAGIRL